MTKRFVGRIAAKVIAGAAALIVMGDAAVAQSYQNMSCDELWYARNAIYAENGYCFQTARAIETFGEACFAPWGELSGEEQQEVDLIRAQETSKGC